MLPSALSSSHLLPSWVMGCLGCWQRPCTSVFGARACLTCPRLCFLLSQQQDGELAAGQRRRRGGGGDRGRGRADLQVHLLRPRGEEGGEPPQQHQVMGKLRSPRAEGRVPPSEARVESLWVCLQESNHPEGQQTLRTRGKGERPAPKHAKGNFTAFEGIHTTHVRVPHAKRLQGRTVFIPKFKKEREREWVREAVLSWQP